MVIHSKYIKTLLKHLSFRAGTKTSSRILDIKLKLKQSKYINILDFRILKKRELTPLVAKYLIDYIEEPTKPKKARALYSRLNEEISQHKPILLWDMLVLMANSTDEHYPRPTSIQKLLVKINTTETPKVVNSHRHNPTYLDLIARRTLATTKEDRDEIDRLITQVVLPSIKKRKRKVVDQ